MTDLETLCLAVVFMGPKAVKSLGLTADDFPEPLRQTVIAVLDAQRNGTAPHKCSTVLASCRRMGFDGAGGIMPAAVAELKRLAAERKRRVLHRTIELLPADSPIRKQAEADLVALMTGSVAKLEMKVVG